MQSQYHGFFTSLFTLKNHKWWTTIIKAIIVSSPLIMSIVPTAQQKLTTCQSMLIQADDKILYLEDFLKAQISDVGRFIEQVGQGYWEVPDLSTRFQEIGRLFGDLQRLMEGAFYMLHQYFLLDAKNAFLANNWTIAKHDLLDGIQHLDDTYVIVLNIWKDVHDNSKSLVEALHDHHGEAVQVATDWVNYMESGLQPLEATLEAKIDEISDILTNAVSVL